jgi:hypothetical protein
MTIRKVVEISPPSRGLDRQNGFKFGRRTLRCVFNELLQIEKSQVRITRC